MAVITRQRFISRGAEAQRKHRERVKRKIKETEEQLSISRASEAKKTQEIASLRARLLRCSNAVQKMSPGTCTTDTTKHATVFDNINVTASPRQVMPDTCVDDPVYEVDKDQPIPTVETPGKDIAEDNDPFHAFFNAVPLDPQPKAWTTTGTGCVEDALKSGTIADYRRDADCRRDVSCDGLPPNTSAPASVLDWTASMDGMTETSLPSDYFDLDLSNSSADCRVETELYRSDQAGRVMDDSGFDVSSTTAGLGAMDQSGASAGGAAKTSEFHLGPSGHQGVMNPIWHTKSTPADARRTYANINDNVGQASWPCMNPVPGAAASLTHSSLLPQPPPVSASRQLDFSSTFPRRSAGEAELLRRSAISSNSFPLALGNISESQAGLITLHYLFRRIMLQLSHESYPQYPILAY